MTLGKEYWYVDSQKFHNTTIASAVELFQQVQLKLWPI